MADEKIVDWSIIRTLRELDDGGEAIYDSLITTYLDCSTDLIEKIKKSAQEGDICTFLNATHRLKGSSGTIGAKKVAMLCGSVEDIGTETSTATLLEYAKKIELAAREVASCLR